MRASGTFVAQAASTRVLHCYVKGYAPKFDRNTVAVRVSLMPGVKGAHLVTAGRSGPDAWCLVVEPRLSVEPGNAKALRQLVGGIARQVGCSQLNLVRPLERRESGPAANLSDWLKW